MRPFTTTRALLDSLASPRCPWPVDEDPELAVRVADVTGTTDTGGEEEEEEEWLRELALRVADVTDMATFPTFSTFSGGVTGTSASGRKSETRTRKETRVSEFVSIIEVVGENEEDDEGSESDEDGPDEFLIIQRSENRHGEKLERSEQDLNVYEVLLVAALYSESVTLASSTAPRALLDALQASMGQSVSSLVKSTLPTAFARLHDVIVAHVEFEEAQVCSTTLDSYDGPSAWNRCMRCMELTWFVKQMEAAWLEEGDADVMVLLHALALGCKDVSYQVRNQSLTCVDAFIAVLRRDRRREGGTSWIDGRGVVGALVDIVKESVSSNDDRCWLAGYRCVGSLLGYLGDRNIHGQFVDADDRIAQRQKQEMLFEHVMGLAERNQHSLVYASVWLETVGLELQAVGVGLMHHAPVLLPMLVEWAKALHADVRTRALRCLLVYVQQCWPRNRATRDMIWEGLEDIAMDAMDATEASGGVVTDGDGDEQRQGADWEVELHRVKAVLSLNRPAPANESRMV